MFRCPWKPEQVVLGIVISLFALWHADGDRGPPPAQRNTVRCAMELVAKRLTHCFSDMPGILCAGCSSPPSCTVLLVLSTAYVSLRIYEAAPTTFSLTPPPARDPDVDALQTGHSFSIV